MIKILFSHPEFMIPVLILLSLSIICQISMGVLCHRLIWETENMSCAKNKSLQQLKLKFSSCHKLHEGLSNVPVFVDKYINQIKVCKISLSTLKHISGQLVLLAILVAGIGACIGIVSGDPVIFIVPYYVISFLGLYCYFAISSLIDVADKTKIMRTNLIDYLENHLAGRLDQTALDLKIVQGEVMPDAKAADERTERNTQKTDAGNERKEENQSPVLSNAEANELGALLKEFLI